MRTKLFLIAACILSSAASQTLTDSSPVWNFGSYATGIGTEASTKAPVGEYISKIEIYKGHTSLGDFGGIKVFYGTTPTASDLAKYYETSLDRVSTTVFHSLTLTST